MTKNKYEAKAKKLKATALGQLKILGDISSAFCTSYGQPRHVNVKSKESQNYNPALMNF